MLSDCVSADRSVSELFVVQDSFERLAKERRPNDASLLCIDASIVEVTGARLDEVLDDEQTKSLIAALGAGIWHRWALLFGHSRKLVRSES